MIDVQTLLEELKSSPYKIVEITAPHTGVADFVVTEKDTKVHGPSGTWREKPGSVLVNLTREQAKLPIRAPLNGVIEELNIKANGQFVEAGTPLVTIRHFLTKEEALEAILKKALYLFPAPENAKYYFFPEIDAKIKASGIESVHVHEGKELFIVSRMKREAPLPYTGPQGIIYAVYFQHNTSVEAGSPLIGICPEDQLNLIQDVVTRVQNDWKEAE